MSRPLDINERFFQTEKNLGSFLIFFAELVKSQKAPVIVIPAFAGVTALETFYETIMFHKSKMILASQWSAFSITSIWW